MKEAVEFATAAMMAVCGRLRAAGDAEGCAVLRQAYTELLVHLTPPPAPAAANPHPDRRAA
jgi:hypothetical protein